MKSHVTVIVKGTTQDVEGDLKAAVEKHRLDEDSLASIRSHHWDYWHLFHDAGLKDPELKDNYPLLGEEVLFNASYVKNLPGDYWTSGVMCLDGTWIDLQDFGWRMLDESSVSNAVAKQHWDLKLKEILTSNGHNIGVEILVHC